VGLQRLQETREAGPGCHVAVLSCTFSPPAARLLLLLLALAPIMHGRVSKPIDKKAMHLFQEAKGDTIGETSRTPLGLSTAAASPQLAPPPNSARRASSSLR
jgi:hypothetical protein